MINSSPDRKGTTKEPIPRVGRKAALAGFVGTFIEYYDYGLFGVLTIYLAPLFFPTSDPSVSLLVVLAVFGSGFIARPIGGIIFGRLGDRHGRRTALLTTVILMGICSTLIGLMPTYATIGIWASILLTVLRLGQGMSAGAEALGSVTYVLESAPPSHRVFLASLTPAGSALGGGLGALLAAVIGTMMSEEAMLAYGWRIPFLVAAPLTVLAFVVRHRIEDSPEFLDLVAHKQISKAPMREAIVTNWRPMVIACTLALGLNGFAGLNGWLATYLAGNRGLPATQVFLLIALGSIAVAFLAPYGGRLADRHGHRRLIVTMALVMLVITAPVLWLLGTATSFVFLFVAILAYLIAVILITPAAYTYMAELFPTSARFTGATFAQNVGTVIAGGTTPLIAGALVLATGSRFGPGIWLGAAILLVLLSMAAVPRLLGSRTSVTPPTQSKVES